MPNASTDAIITGAASKPLNVSIEIGSFTARTVTMNFATLDMSGGSLDVSLPSSGA